MALNSPLLQPQFDTLFVDFDKKYKALMRFAKANSIGTDGKSDLTRYNSFIPQKLRLFRVRLKLAIGIIVDFDLAYAMVKNGPTKDTYIHLLKGNEAWYSFEAMKVFCDSFRWNSSGSNKYQLLTSPELNTIDINNALIATNTQIQLNIYSKPQIKEDVRKYVGFLGRHSEGGLLTRLAITENKIDLAQPLDSIDLLALAYSIRNSYVHQGVSALSGIEKYKNKILLLKVLFDFLIIVQLKVMVHVLDCRITDNNVPYP